MKKQKKLLSTGQKMYTTLLLALLAIVGMTALTVAWFSIANRTDVYSLQMDITSGPSLRIDLDAHSSFEDYVQTLSFDQIAARVQSTYGYDMKTVPLKPVTTSDAKTFTFRSGTVVGSKDGTYWECPLHFMATDDVIVHLTAENSHGKDDGTRVTSPNENLPKSMRISFEADGQTRVYDPGEQNFSSNSDNFQKIFLHFGSEQVYNQSSSVFSLSANTDKMVMMHVWLEGTDEACTDEIKGLDFAIQLRFEATDENGNRISSRGEIA